MVTIRAEQPYDVPAREALLNRAFGVTRWRKTSARLRRGRLPAEGLAFTALDERGRLIGTLRMWNIIAGSAGSALLLGPLAVDKSARGQGVGAVLMNLALDQARKRGFRAVLLVGDEPYYGRYGFTQAPEGLAMPGPVARGRFLARELVSGALAHAKGLIQPDGRMAPAVRKAA